uniref:Uncharacterized protein n=1 Tax=Manihot esculenta TaxID=3983 RepID=A0A2C9WPB1_MANES
MSRRSKKAYHLISVNDWGEKNTILAGRERVQEEEKEWGPQILCILHIE